MIPISKPSVSEEEVSAVAAVLRSGWLSQGAHVVEFERAFAEYVGATHACAVSSCTTAMHLALVALGVGPGDEVITASHSFIATANCIRYCGATPVFIDIDPLTCNINPALIAEAITAKTRAILCVHQVGMPCDMPAILSIATRFGIPVVEDAACAIGSEIRIGGQWQRVGKPHGEIACFSFHPRKVITTGEGGMLTTNNPELAKQLKLLRQHSMSVPDTTRHSATEVIFENYPQIGFNYRMTDIQAALGCEQLKKLPQIIAKRRELADRYAQLLQGMAGLELFSEPECLRSNWQSYLVRLCENVDQRSVMQSMLDGGVATRRGIMCAHREPAYQDGHTWTCSLRVRSAPGIENPCRCEPSSCVKLPESERAQDQVILLPMYPQMTYQDQDSVIAALQQALEIPDYESDKLAVNP